MKKFLFPALFLFLYITSNAQTERITVLTYNILGFPNSGNNDPNGSDAARAIHFVNVVEAADADVIFVQEMTDATGADILLNSLNTNGTLGKTYGKAPSYIQYGTLGNMLFFNEDILNLISQVALPTNFDNVINGNDAPRGICEFVMEVENQNCTQQKTELRFYDMHLKASQGQSNYESREAGARDLMDYINTLAATTNIIAGGDFNFYGDNVSDLPAFPEPGYSYMTSNVHTNTLIDPIGAWIRDNATYTNIFTQSTRAAGNPGYGNGGASGGMDDRFDMIFFNGAVNTNANYVQYVAGSYQTFGNTGVPLNGQSSNTDILYMSDHYPVILQLDVTFDPANACSNCAPSVITFPAN